MDRFLCRFVEADGVVVVVADDDVSAWIEGEVFWAVEAGGVAGSVITGEALFAGGVDEGVDLSGLVDVTEGVAFAAGKVDAVIGAVDGCAGSDEGRFESGAAVFGDSLFSVAGAGGDFEGGEVDLEDFELSEVGNEEVLVIGAEVDGVGLFEGELAVAEGGEFSGVEVDDADAAIEGVGDEKAAIGVEGEVVHAIEAAFGSGTAIACGDVAQLLAAGGFGAGDEGQLVVFEAEDAVAILVLDAVEGIVFVEDDGKRFGEAFNGVGLGEGGGEEKEER